MRRGGLAAVAAGLLAAAWGCEASLPQAQRVDKLRVLAVRAEPPEIAPDGQSLLDALVVSPAAGAGLDGGEPLSYLWLACVEPTDLALPAVCGVTTVGNGGPGTFASAPGGGAEALVPDCARVPGAALCTLGTGATASAAPRMDLGSAGRATLLVTLIVTDGKDAAGAAWSALDCARAAADSGTGAPPDPDHCVIALKRLTVSLAAPDGGASDGGTSDGDGGTGAVTGRHRNPRLTDMRLGAASLADGSARFTAGGPAATVCAAAEPTSTTDPAALFITWFATGGGFDPGRSSLRAAGQDAGADPLGPCLAGDHATTAWTPPAAGEASGPVRLWAVLRDDANGVAWLAGSASAE